MSAPRLRQLAVVAGVALAPAGVAACTAAELPTPEYEEGYEPQYYDGYVVYYDDGGKPYVYVDGAVAWVPETSTYYGPLFSYGRLHAAEYHRWYAGYGFRYRDYRSPRH
jgi:hypothetical protein